MTASRPAAAAAILLLAGCSGGATLIGPVGGQAPGAPGGSGGAPLVAGAGPTGTVTVRNATSGAITGLTAARCGSDDPGPNRLPAGGIAPGAEHSLTVSAGCWDVRAATPAAAAAFDAEEVPAGGTSLLTVRG
ncbi:MAG: hypothetical protein ACU0BS_06970 [Hasllibacter sp.]